jgi:uncharacterized protein
MKSLKIAVEDIKKSNKLERLIDKYCCAAIEDSVKLQDLAVHCTLELVESEILVIGEIAGSITLECCRCLEQIVHRVKLAFSQSFQATDAEIDLEPEIRDTLVLSLPLKPLCRKDCAGLCAHCGKNLNRERCSCTAADHDPRWQTLRETLKEKK